MNEAEVKIRAENRETVIKELVKELQATGAPANIVQLYTMQLDNCHASWIVGKAAAALMHMNGDLQRDQVSEVAMDFAKVVGSKFTFQPENQQEPGLLIPKIKLPGNINN